MKTANRKANQDGSALLITVVITGVLTLAMASYLSMVSTQFRATMRSQEWNAAIPVTEAGIEEAMAHLNHNCNSNGINVASYNPNADEWQTVGTNANMIWKSRTFADKSSFTVMIDLSVPDKPEIYSQGFSVAPLAGFRPKALFAAIGEDGQENSVSYLNRNVRVTTRIIPVFNHALAADEGIQMSGNNVGTDSFNSTNGPYNPSNKNDKGDVATNSNLADDLSVGNANIRGTISIGPGGVKPTIGPNGVVGSNEFVDGGGSGIQDGHWNDDMNVDFEDVEEPFTSGMTPIANYPALTISNYVTTNIIATCSCSGGNNCCIPGGEGGVISPLMTQSTSTTYPASGTYIGGVNTNWTSQTSVSFPTGNVRNVVTNTTPVTTEPYAYPTGNIIGEVTSSIIAAERTKTKPAEGAYEPGTLTKQGAWYNYKVRVYHYQKLTGYTYEKLSSYTYAAISGYQRATTQTHSTTNVTTYSWGFPSSGNYKVSSLSGTIYVGAPVVVYCTGSFTADKLYIAPGASLKLYVGGDISFTGNQKVNEGGYAKNLSLYGLPSCTNIKLAGNAEFTGTIYAPQAFLQIAGGGNDSKDFFGAAIVGSAKLNGHVNFHYDEDLQNSGPSRGYIANSWREE